MKANYEVVGYYGSEVRSFGKFNSWGEAVEQEVRAHQWVRNEDKVWHITIECLNK